MLAIALFLLGCSSNPDIEPQPDFVVDVENPQDCISLQVDGARPNTWFEFDVWGRATGRKYGIDFDETLGPRSSGIGMGDADSIYGPGFTRVTVPEPEWADAVSYFEYKIAITACDSNLENCVYLGDFTASFNGFAGRFILAMDMNSQDNILVIAEDEAYTIGASAPIDGVCDRYKP